MRNLSWRCRCVLAATVIAATARGVELTPPATRPAAESRGRLSNPAVQDSAASITPGPATQPALARVNLLIARLNDDSYAKREEAAAELTKLGEEGVPALEQAAADVNPQTRTSAQAILAEIRGENKPKPAASRDGVRARLHNGQFGLRGLQPGGGGAAAMQLQVVINGHSTREINVQQNGHKVHIREDANGIAMEVTDNGATLETKAADADDLKKNHPEAYAEYERVTGANAGVIELVPTPRR